MGFVADASSGSSTGPAMASARAAASARRAEHRPRFHNASEPRPASGAAREPTRTRAAHAVPKQRARARGRSATRRAVAGGTPADGHNFFWAEAGQSKPRAPEAHAPAWAVHREAERLLLNRLGEKMEGRQETEASLRVERCRACGLCCADALRRVCRRSAVRARSASGSGTRKRHAPHTAC